MEFKVQVKIMNKNLIFFDRESSNSSRLELLTKRDENESESIVKVA